jgi:hypothetical protein
VVVGQAVLAPPPAPITVRDGRLVAAGPLGRALDRQLAASGPAAGVRIQLTFRDRQGAVCRTFEGEAAAGVACREAGRWALRAVFGGQGGPPGMATAWPRPAIRA